MSFHPAWFAEMRYSRGLIKKQTNTDSRVRENDVKKTIAFASPFPAQGAYNFYKR